MTRDRGVIFTDLWADEDWRKLTLGAQWLYKYLLTCASLNSCGVADWRPARITAMNATLTKQMVVEFAAELEREFFVVVDDETEEILIRSFFRHDGILAKPNMMVKAAREFAAISSADIRGVIAHELQRLRDENPNGVGKANVWVQVPQLGTVLKASPIDAKNRLRNPSVNPSEMGSTPTSTSTTTSTPKGVHPNDDFELWWSEYPRKEGKAAAEKAYGKARKAATADELLAGLRRYKLAKIGTEKAFIKMPAGWLNEGRWADDPVVAESRDVPRSAAHNLAPSAPQPPRQDPTIYCRTHEGYPVPCAACEREGGNGEF